MIPHPTEPHAPGEFGEPPSRPASPGIGHYVRKVLKPIASLQLTVVLFVLGMLLIFFGTMAQLDFGIWTVVDKYFWSWVVMVPFDLFHKFFGVFWKEQFPPDTAPWEGSFPFPAGKLIGGLMLLNLLAAHALRFRISWKRLGILSIHSGLILLFVGEYITREYAVEQRMTIDEGKWANFTENSRLVDLTFIDPSDPKTDRVVTIPENMLKNPQGRISDPELPVDVQVVGEFMVNASLAPPKPGQSNTADSGLGKSWIAQSVPEVSGLDEQRINLPAVYVRLYKKGTDESLGTYLTGLQFHLIGREDEVKVDDKTYQMVLRFKRYYKPYRVYLDKFRFDRYMGTQKAKNFSSDVRLDDETGTERRNQRIAMNEPMRYDGETFYQQSFDNKTEKTTILQVVKNPGWRLPYIACALVGFGLVLHFLIGLIRFLQRSSPARLKSAEPSTPALLPTPEGNKAPRILPWIMLGIAALYLLMVGMRTGAPTKPVDLKAFSALPVVDGGRPKPLDSVARVNLRMISNQEEFVDDNGKTQPAIRWYLDTITGGSPEDPGRVWKYKIIRVDNEQVLNELKLERRAGYRYSLNELWPKRQTIIERGTAAKLKKEKKEKLDQNDMKYEELYDRLGRFMDLAVFGGPLLLPPNNGSTEWISLRKFREEAIIESVLMAMHTAQEKIAPQLKDLSEEDEKKLLQSLGMNAEELKPVERKNARERLLTLLKADPAAIDPEMRRVWLNTALALMPESDEKAIRGAMKIEFQRRLATHPAAVAWEELVSAYREDKPKEFTSAVEEISKLNTAAVSSHELSRTRVELFMNRFAPFYQCTGLYVLAFVLSIVGFTQYAAQRPQWGASLRKSASRVILLTFVVHTFALIGRMYIMDRPMVFVTNLYGSAVFIGWGCVALGLIIERIFPIGVGNILAVILGLATTIVAHNLASDDTLEMLQAVLDTNFWLSTHVTTVTLGYTATFVAGFLGALYVFQMLGAVIRDSYQSTGEPTVADLLAFSVATLGVVGIPLTFLWFMTSAMAKFEILPSEILWGLFMLATAVGVVYAIALMLLRVGNPGVDSRGKPLTGQIPNLAQPIAELALTPERGKIFGQMVYGVVCFATLLSFVGTVLGGIWADQSWGRFWGWDPKENGAVLIVLWNSLILHARWAGLVKDRGVAVLAIFGNAITAWSWFGTNQLSIGLHAYGFDSRLADGCFNFWLSQGFILGLGLIPQRFWASAARRPVTPTIPAAVPIAPAPPTTPNVSANANPLPNGSPTTPPSNGQANGHANGQPNGHPHRDKKKRSDKRK